MFTKIYNAIEREIYTIKKHGSYTKTNYLSYIQFLRFLLDLVFFAYLKGKLNTAGSFRVYSLYY